MGMDVYGLKPSSEDGHYFRASIWSWPYITSAMVMAGYDVPKSWSYNDGDGLENREECIVLAELLWQTYFVDLEPLPTDVEHNETHDMAKKVIQELVAAGLEVEEGVASDVEVQATLLRRANHLVEWVRFLRACGGFQIW